MQTVTGRKEVHKKASRRTAAARFVQTQVNRWCVNKDGISCSTLFHLCVYWQESQLFFKFHYYYYYFLFWYSHYSHQLCDTSPYTYLYIYILGNRYFCLLFDAVTSTMQPPFALTFITVVVTMVFLLGYNFFCFVV